MAGDGRVFPGHERSRSFWFWPPVHPDRRSLRPGSTVWVACPARCGNPPDAMSRTEVRAQTGEEFPIFQDRNDIAWGQSWQQRIDETLDAVTLLLVIITPGLFRSLACRAEVTRFLERERALGRQDLILPVYYISAREMDDPGLREADELARVLAARQLADWRELRFEAFTSPAVRKAIAQLAARMRDVFWLPPAAAPARAARGGQAASSPAQAEQAGTTARVIAKTEPPTHVVDAYQRGDFATVGGLDLRGRPGHAGGQRPDGQRRRGVGHCGGLPGQRDPSTQRGMTSSTTEASDQRHRSLWASLPACIRNVAGNSAVDTMGVCSSLRKSAGRTGASRSLWSGSGSPRNWATTRCSPARDGARTG
jgi:hypothetical protein